jgi:hypothetical protein
MVVRGRSLSTKAATEGLFNLARRTPFNVAPEQAVALAEQVFGPATGACSRPCRCNVIA